MSLEQINVRSRKADLAYDSLRSAILDGRLQPGARVVIDGLAKQLGVSRIPVREALKRLEADGFVAVEPHVGVRITDISVDSIHEIYAVKEALEIISGRAACQRMSEGDLEHAESILREMDECIDDLDRWSEGNVRFHEFICHCAGMPIVANLMLRVLDHWERLRRRHLTEVFDGRHRSAHGEHWLLLEALRTGDPDDVERVSHDHNRNRLAAYVQGLAGKAAGESPI